MHGEEADLGAVADERQAHGQQERGGEAICDLKMGRAEIRAFCVYGARRRNAGKCVKK